ncbi:NADH ubiquinone oxidoreductase [Roseobacter sp. HKCCD9010]|uniref:CIA30 family protein n=1 Tax=unclassified Roseobacter TaxID=196798 RepID=UPI00149327AD|nr:NADH ubiquinone oxidoreductase [Rhodobacterales bacterium HKCCD4356]NNV12650.1 NADH ubiquinone oxidoreductase [Roseobacter sp. HKCCD7357]NNV16594.1 NADH ubiquinone oxidoreductase [Roseobacter sp. HKCCD8768]NNV26774.1 NADH ubiquinone oxidoreductase [Roseobacter sp. HKCCD8192]NNV30313.1 NADH ubiquinone oxidoreductase [Roseobacter sp. HKCCD9061]NNV34850.1 NADH ubiquinone oxidoreductase [Roseobacter sp. HKCCD9073]NNV39552.1 NADH ubiquinone oxidoreductase [Roseobacter sp. HKCCD9054]NNV43056.1 
MITRRAVLGGLVTSCLASMGQAGLERNAMTPVSELDWTYLADNVMGGVSEGQAQIEDAAIRLTGTVSTANRGGFIQVRTTLPDGLPPDTAALRLQVRGNGARYFLHLRTTRTRLPWQFYQAGFEAGPDWSDISLPLSAFTPQGQLLSRDLRPEEVRSIGLAAYGQDYVADVSLRALGIG